MHVMKLICIVDLHVHLVFRHSDLNCSQHRCSITQQIRIYITAIILTAHFERNY